MTKLKPVRTDKVNYYLWEDLSEKQKKQVIENNHKLCEYNVDFEWWRDILIDFVEQAKKLEFEIESDDICFELHYRRQHFKVSTNNFSFRNKIISDIIDLPLKFGIYTNHTGGGMTSGIYASEIKELFCDNCELHQKTRPLFIKRLYKLQTLMKKTFEKIGKEYSYRVSFEAIDEGLIANEYEVEESLLINREVENE